MEQILIEKVREHELLYNLKHKLHRSRTKRQEVWETIGNELGITADNARLTWDKLRKCYNNALHRRKSRSVDSYGWRYEELMSFIEPHIEKRNRSYNEQNESYTIEDVNDTVNIKEEYVINNTEERINEEDTTNNNISSSINVIQKRNEKSMKKIIKRQKLHHFSLADTNLQVEIPTQENSPEVNILIEPEMCVWRVVRLIIFVLLVMMATARGREYVDKRGPDQSGSWFITSRYGRSGVDKSRHVVVSARRDDRFITGSRYGKRTSVSPEGEDEGKLGIGHKLVNMDCLYTGISDLYRCISSKNMEASSAFTSK